MFLRIDVGIVVFGIELDAQCAYGVSPSRRVGGKMFRHWGKFGCACAAFVLFSVLTLTLAGPASARDLSSSIIAAEGRAEAASGEIGELKRELSPVASRYAALSHRAGPARAKVKAARRHVALIEKRDEARHREAVTQVRQIEAENRRSAEKHDEKVTSGIGLGLGLLIAGLMVLAWGWLRATAAVAALTRLTLAQAIGLCIGSGFLAILIGAAMQEGSGAVAVLGVALVVLGLTQPITFLLARHSAEVQRGRSRPILRRERFPDRVTQVLAAAFGVLCLLGFGSAILAPGAKSNDVPASVRGKADAGSHQDRGLVVAEAKVLRVMREARPLLVSQGRARADLRRARRAIGHAETRMAAAEDRARSFTHQLVALELHEQREYEREERQAQRRQEQEEREYEKELEREERAAAREQEEAAEAEACDPNYEGACLHEGIGDYDCEGGSGDGPNYVAGPIYVIGFDEFGLDSDGDGVACEDG